MSVGIEALNFYGGSAFIDIRTIFENRELNISRFNNLMMYKKSVGVPCEDVVTNAVNAAKPIIDKLSESEKNKIELLITCSESGIDFGKSISTYVHEYLGLSKNCRLFEIKQACYGGTAGLQMASCFIESQASKGAKALVIASDVARAAVKYTYGEPSQAVGAAAMLISNKPDILELDFGANGYYGYEVMDSCRPKPDIELGESDLSLLSYLDCLEQCYIAYKEKVEGVDFRETFDYLVFHTPFPGMVKGAHRKMIREFSDLKSSEFDIDFNNRMEPSIRYCQQVGNVYSASVYLALSSLIDNIEINSPKRIGIFSYGSGCSSEFYSGIITANSKRKLAVMKIEENLSNRYELTIEEYDKLLDLNLEWIFGIKDKVMDMSAASHIYDKFFKGKGLLVLKEIKDYHREYVWS